MTQPPPPDLSSSPLEGCNEAPLRAPCRLIAVTLRAYAEAALGSITSALPSVLISAPLTACSADEGGGSSDGKISVRSSITPSGALTAPFLYTLEEGYYEDAGLDVTVSDGKGSLSVAKDVAQGNVDIGQVGSPTVAQSVNQGLPLISIAQEYGRGSYGLIVDAKAGVENFEDLAGHSVVVSAGSPETVLLPATMKKLGMDPEDVQMLNVDAAVKGTTYAGGEGDALGTTVPFFMPLVSTQRDSVALPFDEAGITFPDYSLVVRPDYLDDHHEELRKFLEASFEGFAAAANDPEGVAAALKKHRPEVGANIEAQEAQFKAYLDFVCSEAQDGKPVGWHSPEAWQEGLKLLADNDAIEGDPKPVEDYFTNEFFEGDGAIDVQTCEGGEAQ